MTAPALVMVARGSSDPTVAQVTHEMRSGLQSISPRDDRSWRLPRPLPAVRAPGGRPACPAAGHRGGLRAPPAHPCDRVRPVEMDVLVRRSRTSHPDVRFTVSRPVGPEISLLTILDQRLRSALSTARILELDGLVLSAECTGDVRGSALLARRARQWSTHHRLPCLTAVADGSGPSVAQAIMGLRSQGRRHIAVGSFFLSADESYHAQADLAYSTGPSRSASPSARHARCSTWCWPATRSRPWTCSTSVPTNSSSRPVT